MTAGRVLPILAAALSLATPAVAQGPGTRFIEEMTWTEVRDALQAGATTVIVPVGGTEQNGPHMVMGKHNYVITFAANEIARRLGNTLVAPTVQYVPEGDYNEPDFGEHPGVISYPSPDYESLLEAAARSLEAHGFTDILFIGDSGGDQDGLQATADKLNAEWASKKSRVYALTDYYERGQEYSRMWLQAAYGYDRNTIGSHAGITDTSAIMYVFPRGIRYDRIMPFGGSPDAGVRGDPTKASPEIGRMVVEFKVLSALAHYEALKAPARGRPTQPR